MSYRTVIRRVDSAATTVTRALRVWQKDGRNTRKRPNGQPSLTTKHLDRRFRQLALRDRFANILSKKKNQQNTTLPHFPSNPVMKSDMFFLVLEREHIN